MIVLSESLFFGEEMSHRVLKQVETVGEFFMTYPFFNNDYTFNCIVIQLIWVFLKIICGKWVTAIQMKLFSATNHYQAI